jgi:EmrB/QacA subfamily drug resistance transporter
VIEQQRAAESVQYRHRGWILAVMCLALVMVVAGVSMLANALPSLAADLDASQSSQQWIVDAYALVLAALLLPAGAIGDRFGRRGALIAGTAIFGIASALSAFAGSATPLIGLRALTGLGAALLMPGTLSTITSVFPPEERAKAVGIWAGFAGAGGTLGILISGALLEQFWWGSIFVVTAGLALLSCIGVIAVVPSTRSEEHVGLDPRGAVVSALGIGLLVLGIIEGPERGWTDPVTLFGLLGGVAFLVAFIRVELRTENPLLDPRLFRHRGFATGSASLFLQFFAMFGFFFVSLQFLQLVLGYSTFDAALALLPMSIVILPISAVAGTMSERYGHRLVGGIGLAVSAIGFALFATLGTGSGFLPFMFVTIVIGAGAALAMTPATNAIVASLPRAKQGVASAVNDTSRELGAAFGVAVLGSAFNTGYRTSIDGHLGGLPAEVARQAREAPAIAVQLASRVPGGNALADAAREAFTTGMRYAVLVGMGLLVIGALFVWFRGASRTEQLTEDELDDLPHSLAPARSVSAGEYGRSPQSPERVDLEEGAA